MKFLYTVIAAFMLFTGCDDGSTSNPATVTRDDLQPPKQLISVTRSAEVELRWTAFNAEEEFTGYQVFGAATDLETLRTLITYPRTPKIEEMGSFSFPRCKDNDAFFKAFGFPTTKADCEGADETEKSGSSAESEEEEETEEKEVDGEEPLKNFADCYDTDGTKVSNDNASMPISAKVTRGRQSCTVKSIRDADGTATDLVDGTPYVFFVVAVKGDEYAEVSWTSNVVDDVPSATLFDDTVTLTYGANGFETLTDAPSNVGYVKLVIDGSNAITAPTPAVCPDADTLTTTGSYICRLEGKNRAGTAGESAIYFARDGISAGNKQRIFISVSEQGSVALQPKFRATIGGDTGRLPGDQATTTYSAQGVKHTVLGDQIFDFRVTNSDNTYNYGKVIVSSLTHGDGSDLSDNTVAVKFDVTIVYQPKTNETHYLR